jgi:hypothetical protein
MASTRVVPHALVALALQGCGGAQLVLQHPISSQCESTGLKGCDELTRGALLYADGDPEQGRAVLTKGLVANYDKAAELKKFADAMKLLGKVPGAGQYVGALRPVIALIDEAASKAATTQTAVAVVVTRPAEVRPGAIARTLGPTEAEPQPSPATDQWGIDKSRVEAEPAEPAPTVASEKSIVSGYIVPTSDFAAPDARSCDLAVDLKATCVSRRLVVDYMVTDLLVSPTCARELVVLTGPIRRPSWLIWVPAGRGLSEHGMRLPMAKGGALVVGVVDNQKPPIPIGDKQKARSLAGPEWRCGLTWAATVNK